MGAQDNIKVVQDYIQASRDGDEARVRDLLAEDAVIRVSGVPRALGGVVQGRDQILQNLRQQGPPAGQGETRTIFADDTHVCAVQRVNAPFSGTEFFKGNDKPFTTYQCAVFNLNGGRIREQTLYINFLDVYVQAGLVGLDSLRA